MTEAQYQEILDRLTALEQDVAELKEAYQGLDSPSGAATAMNSCHCDTKWQTLYNEDLPKLSLNGTTLVITTRSTTEET